MANDEKRDDCWGVGGVIDEGNLNYIVDVIL
jgi:hypothetical protein